MVDLIAVIEKYAAPELQEDYDNAGLLTGDPSWECTGVICTLDVTEDVVVEAVRRQCNCIVAHHPLIFRGLKRITGSNGVERTLIAAIKNNIAVYAAHTNLDNIITGVNGKIADKLGLTNRKVLDPKQSVLQKLYTFVPEADLNKVRDALFAAGAGDISQYSECSFTHPGTGTFKPGVGTDPYSGSDEREEVELHGGAFRKGLCRMTPDSAGAGKLGALREVFCGSRRGARRAGLESAEGVGGRGTSGTTRK